MSSARQGRNAPFSTHSVFINSFQLCSSIFPPCFKRIPAFLLSFISLPFLFLFLSHTEQYFRRNWHWPFSLLLSAQSQYECAAFKVTLLDGGGIGNRKHLFRCSVSCSTETPKIPLKPIKFGVCNIIEMVKMTLAHVSFHAVKVVSGPGQPIPQWQA